MKTNRNGKISFNKYGSTMILENYISHQNVTVRFVENDYLMNTTYEKFKAGNVKSPYDPSVCEVGYIGKGDHKVSENGKLTKVYTTWYSMLYRAYSENYHKRQATYKDVNVCPEWWNFQTFGDWYNENYYEIENETMEIDKDILIKGNKLYSPETCVFVPNKINTLIIKCNSSRGQLPIGVAFNKKMQKYQSQCANGKGEIIRLGHYDTPEEAFQTYKEMKEKVIKEVVNEYKDRIPDKLYQALYNWNIEIDD